MCQPVNILKSEKQCFKTATLANALKRSALFKHALSVPVLF